MGRENNLFKKVYGSLAGALIGDAMGAPVENKPYWEIDKEFGWIDDFTGFGTDDSALRKMLCNALIEHSGYVTADEFAEAFRKEEHKYYDQYFVPVKNMYHKIDNRLCLPVYAGFGNMQSSSSAMAISPVGLTNACNPRQASIEAYDIAGLFHAGDTTFCRDAACAIAAAVAEAMKPAADVESILAAATKYLHHESSALMAEQIEETLDLARANKDYAAFRKSFYETRLQKIICDSRETVPCALALVFIADGDPVKAITYSANFGRDADTIATMAGAIAGAYKGSDGLKKVWLDKVRATVPEQDLLAEKMLDVVRQRLADAEECASMVRAIDA